MFKKTLYLFIGISLAIATPVLAVQVSVPSAPGIGYYLRSTATGQYTSALLSQLFPFTPQAGGNSTSTTLYLTNGFVSSASSTFSNLAQGFNYIGSDNLHLSAASSSLFGYTPEQPLTFSTPLIRTTNNIAYVGLATTSQPSSSNVLTSDGGSGVYGTATGTVTGAGGVTVTALRYALNGALAITCTAATRAAAGCISVANSNLFSNKVGTSSQETQGNLAYWTTGAGNPPLLGSVATGTVSAGNGISVTANQSIIGTGLTITDIYGYPFTGVSSFGVTAATTTVLYPAGLAAGTSTIGTLVATSSLWVLGSTTVGTSLSGAGLGSCTGGNNALTWSSGAFGCQAIAGTANAFLFTPATNYAVNMNSTTTALWFKYPALGTISLAASSTAAFDQLNIGSTTTGVMSTSTNFGNWVTKGTASSSQEIVSGLGSAGTTNVCAQASGFLTITGCNNGTVTSVATNNGLTGGAITGSGTIGLATINAGVLGAQLNGSVPTSQATSTLYGLGTPGQVLMFSNGGIVWAATSSAAGSVGNWFTPINHFGTTTNATSTLVAFNMGLTSSSTIIVASSTGAELILGNPNATTWFHWNVDNTSILRLATSTNTNIFATSSTWALSITKDGQLSTPETWVSTSTAMVVDWLTTGNQVLVQMGQAAMTIGFNNASTSGMTKRVVVCNPLGTAGALTWATSIAIMWSATPTQTTTAKKCDLYSFFITQATSTSPTTVKVFGAQTTF